MGAHDWGRRCEAQACSGFGVEPATAEMLSPLHGADQWFALCRLCEPMMRRVETEQRSRWLAAKDPRALRTHIRPLVTS